MKLRLDSSSHSPLASAWGYGGDAAIANRFNGFSLMMHIKPEETDLICEWASFEVSWKPLKRLTVTGRFVIPD